MRIVTWNIQHGRANFAAFEGSFTAFEGSGAPAPKGPALGQQTPARSGNEIRAEIRHPRGSAGRVDADLLAESVRQLARLQPDAIAFQEVDRFQPRSNWLNTPEVIARALPGYWFHYAPMFIGFAGGPRIAPPQVPVGSQSAFAKECAFAKKFCAARRVCTHSWPAYGLMLALREPPVAWKVARLGRAPLQRIPQQTGWWAKTLGWRPLPGQNRSLLCAVQADGTVFATTHLEVHAPTARAQLRRSLELLQPLGSPVVLCGDFNLGAQAVQAQLPADSEVISAPTYPVDAPTQSLDQVVITPAPKGGTEYLTPPTERLTHPHANSVLLPVSDHRALYVETTQ
ncbi:endonuclease/exonuclease/phosphatase family protein [Gleimia hominis]|uniref:Endonuclease/exonuclease/phosphatase family protein n=1 Tax=Gleimia hominis TaxID=595468 RepID=A0ABU3I7X6_9ACTO|nr:endonuclease/exonuclease/phosphatase family protein [Gleimia hominis]MDT3766487.1 endonuclease/exonuclease/phosphatase family protein [Gleimia hominis]